MQAIEAANLLTSAFSISFLFGTSKIYSIKIYIQSSSFLLLFFLWLLLINVFTIRISYCWEYGAIDLKLAFAQTPKHYQPRRGTCQIFLEKQKFLLHSTLPTITTATAKAKEKSTLVCFVCGPSVHHCSYRYLFGIFFPNVSSGICLYA